MYVFRDHQRQSGAALGPGPRSQRQILKKEIPVDQLIRKNGWINDVASLVEYWRRRLACKRISSLQDDTMVSHNRSISYIDLAGMSWEQEEER